MVLSREPPKSAAMTTLESKVVSIEKRLDELEETMEILADKETTRSIARGLTDLKKGRFHTYSDVDSLIKGINRV
jgi:hypothetical protein